MGFVLTLAAMAAAAYAVWPVVADAPWEDSRTSPSSREADSVPSAAPTSEGLSSDDLVPPDGASLDRTDCNAVRGSAYRSPAERAWFLRNCITPEPESPSDYGYDNDYDPGGRYDFGVDFNFNSTPDFAPDFDYGFDYDYGYDYGHDPDYGFDSDYGYDYDQYDYDQYDYDGY